ncbi:MAG: DmsC/YnfH family molybdoenzyme membrane anchor subunit [Microthrixaceae bacterium]
MTSVLEPSAVETFDRWHGVERLRAGTNPAPSSYRAPLPATAPRPGEQYRFEVDLDACTGCKACVTACHSLNGLDPGEAWRSVGLLIGEGPWQQHVTTACHHCVEPACLAGCPVEAYEKDPITGIVAHLDDQCIGCRYCMLTCPYEVPRFNQRLGIVRKCDMCSDRLAEGEAPACVQGCPTNAISIGLVSGTEAGTTAFGDPEPRLVPTAPLSSITRPTTVYITRRPRPVDPVAADDHRVVPAHDHPPLVAMLVLTQLSVGAFVATVLCGAVGDPRRAATAAIAWMSAVVALGASVMHLGRPLLAWRALLGLGHSWLSREILAFGVYAPLGGAVAAADVGWLPRRWAPVLGVATALVGLAGVGCSAMLYAATRRPSWRLDRIVARFAVTMATTGGAAVGLAGSLDGAATGAPVTAGVVATIGGSLGGMAMTAVYVVRHRDDDGALGRSVSLLAGPLRTRLAAALAAAWCTIAVAGAIAALRPAGAAAVGAWILVVTSALVAAGLERSLFFTTSSPDRMPGGLR